MGKMLLLSFENSEDDVISEILSILENKQMKICENKIKIVKVVKIIIAKDKQSKRTGPNFFFFLYLLAITSTPTFLTYII